MKIHLKEFLLFKKISIILNFAFILMLVMFNVFFLTGKNLNFISQHDRLIQIISPLYVFSIFFFLIYMFFTFYFYKKNKIFVFKFIKFYLFLYLIIFLTILSGGFVLSAVIWLIGNINDDIYRYLSTIGSMLMIIFLFLGISINLKIFTIWQSTSFLDEINKIEEKKI